jgi:tetratricopeptide (TPR) repeat protein
MSTHRTTYQTYLASAESAVTLSNFASAQRIYQQALRTLHEVDDRDFEVAELSLRLARLQRRKGFMKRAFILYRNALLRFSQIKGECSSEAIAILFELADTALTQKRPRLAVKYYRTAMERFEGCSAPRAEVLVHCATELAVHFEFAGRREPANKLFGIVCGMSHVSKPLDEA